MWSKALTSLDLNNHKPMFDFLFLERLFLYLFSTVLGFFFISFVFFFFVFRKQFGVYEFILLFLFIKNPPNKQSLNHPHDFFVNSLGAH